MEINNKKVKIEDEILEMFNIQKSTISEWYRKGLKKFKINRKNYVFEDDLEMYFRGICQ